MPEIEAASGEPTVTTIPLAALPASSLQSHKLVEPAPGRVAAFILGAYLVVAVFLALRVDGSLAAVRRLRGRCQPVDDPEWVIAMHQTRDRLGIGCPVVAGEVGSHLGSDGHRLASAGDHLAGRLDGHRGPKLIEMVILHELADVRRGDFGWNLVHKLVRLVYWPHPLVWLLGRIVGSVREQACDDLCVHVLGGSAAYRASLIEVASGLLSRPDPSMGLAFARATNLGRRLAWIDQSPGASRCILSMPARLAIGAIIVAFAAAVGSIELDRSPARADEEPNEHAAPAVEQSKPSDVRTNELQTPEPAAIEIVVLAKDSGKPLAGATIRASIDFQTSIRKTDNDGGPEST